MALITGGNVLVVVAITIVLMVVVALVLLVSVFNLDSLLSVSLADIVKQEQAVVSEVSEERKQENTVVEELNVETVRQSLGFIEYPIVNVQTGQINIFSPQAVTTVLRLSEEKIAERCAHVTISFNHDRCLLAERGCAAVLESSREHWKCLNKYAFYIGKKL